MRKPFYGWWIVSMGVLGNALQGGFIFWTMGGLDGRTWDHVLIILPIVLSGFVLLLFYSKQLDLLLLGEQHALSVGVDVRKTRRNLLIISTAMVGASVSSAQGPEGGCAMAMPVVRKSSVSRTS